MLYIFIFIFGTIFGSFASVLIWRIGLKETGIVAWRSECPHCKHVLWVLDLIPVFSWIFLWGRCKYCEKKIRLIYPLLELVMWIFFLLATYIFFTIYWVSNIVEWLIILRNHFLVFIYLLLIAFVLVVLIFYDIIFYELSDKFWLLLLTLILVPQFFWHFGNFQLAVICGLIWFSIFMLIRYWRLYLRKMEWLGGGDIFMAFVIWLFVPVIMQIHHIDYMFWVIVFYMTIFLWFLLWWLFWSIQLLIGKVSWKYSAIPFLPYMIIWLVISIFFMDKILAFIV